MRRRAWFVFAFLVLLAGPACRSLPAAGPAGPPPAPPVAPTDRAAGLSDGVRWVRDAAEYQAAVLQVYRLATARLEQLAPGRPAGSWAVVLDADETIISNLAYQIERARAGLAFTAESWNQWVRRREATPLPGAASFLSRTRALGGRIAVVTNRLGSECEDTAAVFRAHALVYDAMLCRPDGSPPDKTPRVEAVAAGQTPAGSTPLDIVLFIGDNILDFPGLRQSAHQQGFGAFSDFGVRFFVVPNPMYGSWQTPE